MVTYAPQIPDAIMIDSALGKIAKTLKDNIGWLDATFGRAQRLTATIEEKKYVTPNVYVGNSTGRGKNDYLPLLPDSHIGNFSFFLIDDPEQIEWQQFQQMKTTTPISLIVWFDLRHVYDSPTNRNTEKLKAQILYELNGRNTGFAVNGGRIVISKIWERAENIYKGFTIDEIDNQFLMHPYGGFRFDGTLELETPCTL